MGKRMKKVLNLIDMSLSFAAWKNIYIMLKVQQSEIITSHVFFPNMYFF